MNRHFEDSRLGLVNMKKNLETDTRNLLVIDMVILEVEILMKDMKKVLVLMDMKKVLLMKDMKKILVLMKDMKKNLAEDRKKNLAEDRKKNL